MILDCAALHYLAYPEPRADRMDRRAEEMVARMQAVVELVRNVRDVDNISVKVPLSEVIVVHEDEAFLADLRALQQTMVAEVNIKTVALTSDDAKYATLCAEPDQRALGQTYGKQFNAQVKSAIAGARRARVCTLKLWG
jgi:isoleucyl-tRNA synthetase